MSDLSETAIEQRGGVGSLDLMAYADFNGDGVADDAHFVRDLNQYAVLVTLKGRVPGDKVHILDTGPLRHLQTRGIRVTRKNTLLDSLRTSGRAEKVDAARAVAASAATDILVAFTYESSAAAYVWSGGKFNRVNIAD